jgi:hypothetical protein
MHFVLFEVSRNEVTDGVKEPKPDHQSMMIRATQPSRSWHQALQDNLVEIDAFGSVLLGFGWSLILLPSSFRSYANGVWRNLSLITMMIMGGLLLIVYVVYEICWSRVPSAPRRLIFNKTFLMSLMIGTFYESRKHKLPPASSSH